MQQLIIYTTQYEKNNRTTPQPQYNQVYFHRRYCFIVIDCCSLFSSSFMPRSSLCVSSLSNTHSNISSATFIQIQSICDNTCIHLNILQICLESFTVLFEPGLSSFMINLLYSWSIFQINIIYIFNCCFAPCL